MKILKHLHIYILVALMVITLAFSPISVQAGLLLDLENSAIDLAADLLEGHFLNALKDDLKRNTGMSELEANQAVNNWLNNNNNTSRLRGIAVDAVQQADDASKNAIQNMKDYVTEWMQINGTLPDQLLQFEIDKYNGVGLGALQTYIADRVSNELLLRDGWNEPGYNDNGQNPSDVPGVDGAITYNGFTSISYSNFCAIQSVLKSYFTGATHHVDNIFNTVSNNISSYDGLYLLLGDFNTVDNTNIILFVSTQPFQYDIFGSYIGNQNYYAVFDHTKNWPRIHYVDGTLLSYFYNFISNGYYIYNNGGLFCWMPSAQQNPAVSIETYYAFYVYNDKNPPPSVIYNNNNNVNNIITNYNNDNDYITTLPKDSNGNPYMVDNSITNYVTINLPDNITNNNYGDNGDGDNGDDGGGGNNNTGSGNTTVSVNLGPVTDVLNKILKFLQEHFDGSGSGSGNGNGDTVNEGDTINEGDTKETEWNFDFKVGFDGITDLLNSVINLIKDVLVSAIDGLTNIVSSGIEGITKSFTSAVDGLNSILNFLKTLVDSFFESLTEWIKDQFRLDSDYVETQTNIFLEEVKQKVGFSKFDELTNAFEMQVAEAEIFTVSPVVRNSDANTLSQTNSNPYGSAQFEINDSFLDSAIDEFQPIIHGFFDFLFILFNVSQFMLLFRRIRISGIGKAGGALGDKG
jgi:hypothetical protein